MAEQTEVKQLVHAVVQVRLPVRDIVGSLWGGWPQEKGTNSR